MNQQLINAHQSTIAVFTIRSDWATCQRAVEIVAALSLKIEKLRNEMG